MTSALAGKAEAGIVSEVEPQSYGRRKQGKAMAKRKRQPGEVSTRTRFEVFKRDLFTCQYCGRKTPDVVLHCDHIIAIANGGDSTIDNLITSCASCNLGKSDVPLDQAQPGLASKIEQMKEARAQLKAYKKLLADAEAEINDDIDRVEAAFRGTFRNMSFTHGFRYRSMRTFLEKLPVSELEAAMFKACSRVYTNPDAAIKYFCGICCRKIKGE